MKLHKKVGLGALVCALSLQVFTSVSLPGKSLAADSSLALGSQEIITSGAILKKYVWSTTRNNKQVTANASVIEVDLTNPNVKLDAMAGANNQFTKKESVSQMVKEKGAVAGINGDFYNTQAEGVPEGPQITSGQLMATPATLVTGMYAFAVSKENVPIIDQFTFQGSIVAKDGASFNLGGINKTYYWDDSGNFSLKDAMYMYTNVWGQTNRSNDGTTVPTEILVQNNKIIKIASPGVIDMIAPADGYILRASGKATDFVNQHLKVGDPLVANYEMLPKDAWNHYDVKNFKMMIGGNTLLVYEGKPLGYFTRDINGLDGLRYRSRTAIGYSKDLKTAYLITVDTSGSSNGVNLSELQQFMVQAGVWKGMLLDGGGSTQMVARPLGEFDSKLVIKTENGNERKIVNGVGVFSTAPKGDVKGITLKGQKELFINESSIYQLKAYDEYYNPVAADTMTTQWASSAPIGTFNGNAFTATKSGQTKLSAQSGKGVATIDVQVIGRDQISSMKINTGDISLSDGQSYKLPVMVTTKSGMTREVPAGLIQWEVKGIGAQIGTDGILKVSNLSGSQGAQLVARYDGYSTMLTLPIGQEKLWYDLDTTGVMTTAGKYPAEVVSNVAIDSSTGNKNLGIAYDFTKGTGTKAAYALFNDKYGAPIDGEPQYLKMKVFGDGSMNWLRAEFMDAAGKAYKVDLTQNMNWKGWQQVTANLTDYGMKYPVVIKSIYVANPEQGQDERALTGKINLDDILFVYKGTLPALPQSKVKLTINKTAVSLNNKTMTLEQAPIIMSGNTMIPVRFVTEALGGTIKWDDRERKVTITRGDKLIELWIDNPDLLVNGDRITAEVAPKIINNLTLVPLRIISEQLGWKVGWEPVGQVITLQ